MTTKAEETMEMKYSELAELDKKHFFHPTTSFKQQQAQGPKFIFTEGKGIYLKDVRGKTVIDGLSSLWNVNIGHGREELGIAAMKQMKQLAFSSTFATNSHERVIELAEKVAKMAPGDLNMTFFTSGGSEANDTAFKTVRHYWQLKGKTAKKKIITRNKSYHGVSMGASSATGLPAFRAFPSLAPDFLYVDSSIEDLERLIAEEGADTIAAFVSEPVQGSGGVNPPPEDYFKKIRALCDRHDILFIADEVITGFGRTGTTFGMNNYDTVPDIMVIAKGITSGYAPLGGMVISEKLKNELIELSDGVFMHGYTYSGHPMCCAVALENLRIIEDEKLIENVQNMGDEFQKGFKWLADKHDVISDTRGIGLLGAVEIMKDKETKTRFDEPVSVKVIEEALNHGLLGRSIIYEGQDTLAFAPPFCINKEEVETVISIIDKSMTTVLNQLK
ncbi:aspartate aminotransferase family protein [Sporosarcina sp. Sa2YVA2]|uniref:Aspartate aminotransferase family protein n=1 Tax=Sporosarcina quadrami TaxID=2762234 RepID=A0ABR8UAJ0_9BACL|nr:aspartate aminotransferase family protein [Sporosarcina quadrami]MBD7985043.1 aspartate aminotransferase family protein [Sporosarcina quadrami]